MKKIIAAAICLVMLLGMLAGCGGAAPAAAPAAEKPAEAAPAAEAPAGDKKPAVGFVTFGLGGDFFQALADTFVKTMNDAGWDASYVDGEFNPTSQIAAMENYIAQGVDVIVLWSVAPEAMDAVIGQAQAAG
ncbi:MAG: substrate-binding domain-containing protein, partial [Oscillospiraceae bacterium]|nr:substrate-binding domain-containing protein [Oscillospiraceae bacterium]